MNSDKPGAASPAAGRRGVAANLVLAAAWAYVTMICLLALDQQFHWGVF
jgi:hypothetical protein